MIKKALSTILVPTLVITMFVGVFMIQPKTARAQFATVEAPGPQLTATAATAAETTAETVKSKVLDGVAWSFINVAIDVMTQDIINWINSGFSGSPAFVQDPGSLFQRTADIAAGEFLKNTQLGFLCKPFKLDALLAIELSYYQGDGDVLDQYTCTLSEVGNNVEDFVNDAQNGGLGRFIQVTGNPHNNPYDVAFGVKAALETKVTTAVGQKKDDVALGNGFMSFRECKAGEKRPNCTGAVQTPGSVIEAQLNHSLGLPSDRLSVADEFNEIVSALMGQLVKQALGGSGGLATAGSSSAFNQTSDITEANVNTELAKLVSDAQLYVDIYEKLSQDLQVLATRTYDAIDCIRNSSPTDQTLSDLSRTSSQISSDLQQTQKGVEKGNNILSELKKLQDELSSADTEAKKKEVAVKVDAMVKTNNTITINEIGNANTDKQNMQTKLQNYEDTIKIGEQKCSNLNSIGG